MIRAHVQQDPESFGLRVILANHDEDSGRPREVVQLIAPEDGDQYFKLVQTGPGLLIDRPTLRLPDDMARALLDALTRHYHGAEDSRALRRDYDDERRRVDKLTDTLAVIARQVTEPPPVQHVTAGLKL